MLKTTNRSHFDIQITDSTVTFFQGTARILDTLVPFTGTSRTFPQMSSLTGIVGYQNTLMYLTMTDTSTMAPDMTQVQSPIVSSQVALTYPAMPDSSGFPVALFTFQSDATTIQNISYQSI